MTELAADEFLTAMQMRHAICRALLDLSRKQAALIAAEEFDQLLEVLQTKQDLLNHMNQLSPARSPLQQAWSAERDQLPTAIRQRCETVLAETESLLADLLSEEQTSTTQLTARRDATQRELQSLAVGSQAQQAYQSRPSPVLSRLDLNS